MKKMIALLLVLMMGLALVACGDMTPTNDSKTEPEKTEPVETEPVETEPATPSINSIIKSAVLQYPSSNELFKYNA